MSANQKTQTRKLHSSPSHPHFASEWDELCQRERWEVIRDMFQHCYEEAFGHIWKAATEQPMPIQAIASEDFAAGYRFARQQMAKALEQDLFQEIVSTPGADTIAWKYVDRLLFAEHKLSLEIPTRPQKSLDL